MVVDVLASPENAPVLAGNPYVSSVIVADRRRPLTYLSAFRRIRRTPYDAILDCQVFSPSTTTLAMMLASRARHRVGLAGRGIDDALTDPVPRPVAAGHYVEHLGALAIPFGVDHAKTDWRPELFLTPAERARAEARWRPRGVTRRLLVNISASRPARRWPEARFAEILTLLRARSDLDIALIAAPSDADVARRLAAATGVVFEATGAVRDALALVATADYVFTPDTAIAHAASAFGKPAVVLFIRNRAHVWGLYGTAGHELSAPTGELASLPVEPVREALARMLGPGA